MKKLILIIALLVVAALCNSVMDMSEHHKGGAFCRLTHDQALHNWFNCSGDSWLNKYQDGQVEKGQKKILVVGIQMPYPSQFTDSFHFFKMLMVFSLCAIVAITCSGIKQLTKSRRLSFLLYWIMAGGIWNIVFNLFYDYLLR